MGTRIVEWMEWKMALGKEKGWGNEDEIGEQKQEWRRRKERGEYCASGIRHIDPQFRQCENCEHGRGEMSQFINDALFLYTCVVVLCNYRYRSSCYCCSIGAQQLQCGPCHDPPPRHCPLIHDHHGRPPQDAR